MLESFARLFYLECHRFLCFSLLSFSATENKYMEVPMAGLSLSVDEDEELVLDIESEETITEFSEFCLVGRFLTDRHVNFNAMKHRLASIWRPGKGICIKEINSHLFLFQFFHILDLKRVMDGGPWSFDNHLLLLHHLKRGEVPTSLPLFHAQFWIQIHDLPVGFMSESVGRQLGNFIGTFKEYDLNNNSDGLWKNYMRIQVSLDVQVSLKRWKKIRQP